ncbi:MAG TPA: (d)CMP kinase [Rubrobacter sp.]|nr:(d)CMP kinase [Rubrobacter sp.]
MKGILVTIDGPAGSGKSSVARHVAARLGVVNLNTGAAYRAAALLALREGADLSDDEKLAGLARRVGLDPEGASIDGASVPDPDLRTPEVAAAASRVSASAGLREVLLPVQRAAADAARDGGGAVVEGRDIGTVVLPDAELKVFLLADPEERARRRARQTGREGELDRIRDAISRRDRQDSERELSPLKPAPDAVVLDTTALSLEEVVSRVLDMASGLRRGA